MAFTVELLVGLGTLVLLFVFYRKWCYRYWSKKNVPYLEPTSLVWGNLENPIASKKGLKYNIKDAYVELKKRGHKYGGIYFTSDPVFIPTDLELVKNILSKDFQYFHSHGIPYNAEKDPLSANIFNLDGEDWKIIRSKISPTFTSGKMKIMFDTLLKCGYPMIDHIDNSSKRDETLDVKNILASYTTDVIGSCAFGLECNSFTDPNAEFMRYGHKVFAPSLANAFKMLIAFGIPWLGKLLQFRMVSMDIENFFMNVIRNVFEYRDANNVKRNDFIQLFIEMKERAKQTGEQTLSLEQIVAQAFVFFLAGFETSSATMTLCLHELAFNQEMQNKLREEIRANMRKHNGQLIYDGVMEMKYLEQVVNETLRKYPIVPMSMRQCTKDYKVPNTQLTLEKGLKVFISILGIHRDPQYYPEPDKFDPERFTEENATRRPQYAYIPFSEGPRICIGMRFGLMQTKTGLCMLLNKYRFQPVEGDKYEIEFDPKSFNLAKKGSVMLRAQKL